MIGGDERTVFADVLMAAVASEGAWQLTRRTNGMTARRRAPEGPDADKAVGVNSLVSGARPPG